MQDETTLYNLRRDWLAAAMRGEHPDWPASIVGDVDGMLTVAEDEGICALLDETLRTYAASWIVPAAFSEGIAAIAHRQVVIEMLRRGDLVRIVQALAAAGLPMLLLKGAALAYGAYPSPSMRPRGDTDLLLCDIAAADRCKPVLAELGYAASKVPTTTVMAYELVFRRDGQGDHVHWIDAHWALVNNAVYASCFGFDELVTESKALPMLGESARGLGNIHALLHACMHRVSNLPFAIGDRLIWLYDIDLLLRRLHAADFERLRELATQRGLAGACWDGLRATVAAFATPLPDGWLAALEHAARNEHFDIRKANRRWYLEWHNLRALPFAKRGAWIWEKLFPHPAYMRDLYAIDSRWKLAWMYVYRLGHGLAITVRG